MPNKIIESWVRLLGLRYRGVVFAITMLMTTAGQAELVELRIDSTAPFAGGASFGKAGSYQRVAGVAIGELDPEDPRNAGIELLEDAPRNARGRVEYEVDFFMLAPSSGSDVLLYDVTNRGSKVALNFFNEATLGRHLAPAGPGSLEEAGNGFLMQRGYAVVWSGWDPTVTSGGMSARFPTATRDGSALEARVRDEFSYGIFPAEIPAQATLSYPALRNASAVLTQRERENDPPRVVPAERWTWKDDQHIALLEGSFESGALYDFRYSAAGPPVLGIGFAAVRDLVSYLRYEEHDRAGRANPLRGREGRHPKAAIGVGVSQSGRYLRHFLELDMNHDGKDRRVFDGLLPYIAGAGKVFANHAFGQPGRTAGQHLQRLFPEHWYPFAHRAVADPLTGRNEGLLPGRSTDPKIIEVNTATEYWHKGASLLHTDPMGKVDLSPPDSVRLFLVAGTEHAGGVLVRDQTCANQGNPHRPNAALRALLVALDEWVRDGRQPPDSLIPRLTDGTLVPLEAYRFPDLPGVTVAKRMNRIRVPGDWIDPPRKDGRIYGAHVPQVDADGIELAGLRLPDIAVPTATYTGWNVFAKGFPTPDLCGRSGSFIPFPLDPDARDPRVAIRERYPTHAHYVERVAAEVRGLVARRLLLAEDGDRYVAAAKGQIEPWQD
jgi:hypothetical protein